MIMHLYSSRNKKSGQFGKLTTELYEPSQIVQLYANSVKEASDNDKIYLRELDIYHVGTLDTETGSITPLNEFLVDVSTLLGEVSHGKETSESFK